MATNSAPTQEAPPPPTAALWPAPAFVLGVAALAVVCLCRPLYHNHDRGANRLLAQARHVLDKPDGDPNQAVKLAHRALDAGARQGEASLVLGGAHLRLAEKAEGPAAVEHWVSARLYLGQAEEQGVASDEDRAALAFSLAKVESHDGGDPKKIIERLEKPAAQIDRPEVYELLTQAYLRLDPPDLVNAKKANDLLRATPKLAGPDLAIAQLTGGDLLLRLGKPQEARETLLLIKEQHAPPHVLVRAHLLLARCYQDETQYEPAVKLYVAALADGRTTISQPAQVYYNLGLCYARSNKPQEAAKAWTECVGKASGDEAPAALVVLAEMGLLNNDPPEKVIGYLTRAVAVVDSPKKWKNPLVDLGHACKIFEAAITSFRQAGRHDLALKTLEPYSHLAEPRRALQLRGELSAEWARLRREKAPDGPSAPDADRQTTELFVQAAKAYSDVADLADAKPNEKADNLWSAVTCHLAAKRDDPGQGAAAAQKLERLVAMELEPARMGEAWYLLGEEYRGAADAKKAEVAYQECIKYATRFAYLARYQLAMAALGRGEIDAAREILKTNLSLLTWDTDAEAMSQTLFAFCGLLYRVGRYQEVARHYEEALNRYRDRFKDKAELALARFQLADSYQKIASQENAKALLSDNQSKEAKAFFQAEHRRWLLKAAEEFAGLDAFLEMPEGQGCLTAEQRAQVPLLTAKCWYYLGKYAEAQVIYERLIVKYKGKAEVLDALGGAVSCHAALGNEAMVRQRLVEIAIAIKDMPAEVRDPWQKWLEEAKRGLEAAKDA